MTLGRIRVETGTTIQQFDFLLRCSKITAPKQRDRAMESIQHVVANVGIIGGAIDDFVATYGRSGYMHGAPVQPAIKLSGNADAIGFGHIGFRVVLVGTPHPSPRQNSFGYLQITG